MGRVARIGVSVAMACGLVIGASALPANAAQNFSAFGAAVFSPAATGSATLTMVGTFSAVGITYIGVVSGSATSPEGCNSAGYCEYSLALASTPTSGFRADGCTLSFNLFGSPAIPMVLFCQTVAVKFVTLEPQTIYFTMAFSHFDGFAGAGTFVA